jgi:hypothetical protein
MMPSALVKKVADMTDLTKKEAEDRWNAAKKIVTDEYGKTEKDLGFWALVTGVFLKSIGTKNVEKITETSVTADAAITATAPQYREDGTLQGLMVFRVPENTFWKLGKEARQKYQWHRTWAGDDRIAEYVKSGNKKFYIASESSNIYRLIDLNS